MPTRLKNWKLPPRELFEMGKLDGLRDFTIPYKKINGKAVCRWCWGELSGRQRGWCSTACIDQYCDLKPKALREAVKRRDKGKCAQCGEVKPWDADHIVPLAEGGSNRLENLRTLCKDCHKKETAALAARLAQRRREAK